MKKKNAIMVADTRSALIGNLLVQIKDTNPELFDEAIIYYDHLEKNDKKVISQIMPCRFIKFDYELPNEIKDKPAFKKFSPLMFSRYYMFDLLDEYETITWIDTDVLICGDISSVISKARKNGMSANFEDPINKSYLVTDTVRTSFSNPIPKYDMTRYNMSSGLISVADSLKNRNKMTKWCFDKTKEYADYLVLPDQGVLNILVQEFNISVASVGEHGAYCFYPTYERDSSKAKIVHAWGARKFWKSWYLFNKYPKWYEYYKEWISLGGSDYFKTIAPEVSVVIPTYNPNTHYLDNVLSDLLVNQVQESNFQYDNFEIIIVIDGDVKKDFEDLIEKYNDPRVKIIKNKERAGIAKSINIGIKESKGKYIARIDDDDRVKPTRLYKQAKFLNDNKDINLVSSYFEYFGDMNESRITLDGELSKAWSIFTCPFDHPTIMFKKEFFVKNKLFYDESRSHVEDWELWLRAFDKGLNVGVIPEVLYSHRWYNGQAGQNNKTIDMMRELVKNNFKKLDVSLSKEDLTIVPPWQGKVSDTQYSRIEKIFKKAIENNKKKKLYDEVALRTVFDFRLEEAKTGRLNSLILGNNNEPVQNISQPVETRSHKIKRKILSPIYKPFKRVFYNISSEAIVDNLGYTSKRVDDLVYINNEIKNVNNSIKNNTELLPIINEDLKKGLKENDRTYNYLSNHIKELENKINEITKQNVELEEKINKEKELFEGRFTNIHDNLYDLSMNHKYISDLDLSNLYFKKKIVLFGTSEHSNIGDAAITVGVYNFIKKYFSDYLFIEVSTYEFADNFPKIQNIINDEDIILLQGGGNLGNKYIVEENVRREVISTFINNKIVILPQTIYFDDTELGKREYSKTKEIYNRHNNLIIFTRGEISKKIAQDLTSVEPHISLDMALNLNYDYKNERSGILCCIRDVGDESAFDKITYNKLLNSIKDVDKNCGFTNNLFEKDIRKENRFNVVYNQFKLFSKYKLVVTDRLHGLIFSLITNTPCIVISSYNYKLKEFTDMLKNNEMVKFIDKDIDNVDKAIKEMFDKQYDKNNDFTNEMKKIANIIKEK